MAVAASVRGLRSAQATRLVPGAVTGHRAERRPVHVKWQSSELEISVRSTVTFAENLGKCARFGTELRNQEPGTNPRHKTKSLLWLN